MTMTHENTIGLRGKIWGFSGLTVAEACESYRDNTHRIQGSLPAKRVESCLYCSKFRLVLTASVARSNFSADYQAPPPGSDCRVSMPAQSCRIAINHEF